MDFSFSEEQLLLRESVGKYVDNNGGVERHRQLCGTQLGYDPAAWQQFAERVKAMGQFVQADSVPKNELEVAEGYRFLLAQLSEEIQVALYRSDLNDPLLRGTSITKFSSLAIPSSDAKYMNLQIEDSGVYRLWGKMGTAKGDISLQFYSTAKALESLSLRDYIDADNHFDIQFGGEAPKDAVKRKNWLPIPKGATLVLFREYFSDWDSEERTKMYVDRLNRTPRVEPLSPEKMTGILTMVNERSDHLLPLFMKGLTHYRNKLQNTVAPAANINDSGIKANLYGPGWFNLRDDETLVLTIDQSNSQYWSVQLGNFWGEAIDFVNYPSSINGDQAVIGSDGKYWLVISKQDPGVVNWIDTAGHNEGMIFTRYQGVSSSPNQVTQLVKLSELNKVLPEGTATVSAEQRFRELRRRHAHISRRYAP